MPPLKVYTQIVFWVVVFFLYILLKEYPQRLSGAALICLVIQETLELALPSYSQNLLILPLLTRGRWWWGGLLYLVQLFLLVTCLPWLLNAVGFLFGAAFHVQDLVDWRKEHITFSMVAFTVIAACVKVALDRLVLEKERKESELRHLKAQLNPHFLFNTLNNLYGLSLTDARRLPALMLKLSDLLRYSLYETQQHYVPLQKEIDYISGYVELEQIRMSSGTDIRLEIEGDTGERYIAPLLLIVLVENAFKHLSASSGVQPFVHIGIGIEGQRLHMQVGNSVDPSYVPGKRKGGLGLNNVRQRLDLIYPGQYHFSTRRDPDRFEASLQIDLT